MTLRLLLAYAWVSRDPIITCVSIDTPSIHTHTHTHTLIQSPYRGSRGEPQKEYGMFCHLLGRLSLKSHIQLSLPALSRLGHKGGTHTHTHTHTHTQTHAHVLPVKHAQSCMKILIILALGLSLHAEKCVNWPEFLPQSCDSRDL